MELWRERFSQVKTERLRGAVLNLVCCLFVLAFVVEGVSHDVLEASVHIRHSDSN